MINEKILSAEKEVLKDEIVGAYVDVASTMKMVADAIKYYNDKDDMDGKIAWADEVIRKADWLRDEVAKLKLAKEKLELLKVVGA